MTGGCHASPFAGSENEVPTTKCNRNCISPTEETEDDGIGSHVSRLYDSMKGEKEEETSSIAPSVTVTWNRQDWSSGGEGRGIFAVRETIGDQMARIRRETVVNPDKIERAMKRGQVLIRTASEGHLQRLDLVVSECPSGEMLAWFSIRMFKEACLHHHLSIIRYMVSNGFDVHFHAISEAVHWVVSGCDEATDGDASKPALKFLANEAGMSINLQRKIDFRTPLHLAVRRGLYQVACCLIELGADVNAVAKDDEMPLALAEKQYSDEVADASSPQNRRGKARETATVAQSPASKALVTEGEMETKQNILTPVHTEPATEDVKCARQIFEHESESHAPFHTRGSGGENYRWGDNDGQHVLSPPRGRCLAVTNRARICGLLLEKGARRTWRRSPSEYQSAIDKKYAVLLEGDDGRTFHTFSG